jgi:hypothetical protein
LFWSATTVKGISCPVDSALPVPFEPSNVVRVAMYEPALRASAKVQTTLASELLQFGDVTVSPRDC